MPPIVTVIVLLSLIIISLALTKPPRLVIIKFIFPVWIPFIIPKTDTTVITTPLIDIFPILVIFI